MNNPLFAKIRAPKTPPIAERAYKIMATVTLLANIEWVVKVITPSSTCF